MLYIIILGTLSIIGYAYFSHAKNMKFHNEDTKNYSLESEYKNAPAIIEKLMDNELRAIKTPMQNKPIEAINQCLPIKNLQSQITGVAFILLKTLAWRAVGFRIRHREKANVAYSILSEDSLHYLHFIENKLTDHKIYNKSALMNAQYTDTSTTDQMTRTIGIRTKLKKMVLESDGKKEEIILMPVIIFSPDGRTMHYGKTAIDFNIMSTYFHEKIKEKILNN